MTAAPRKRGISFSVILPPMEKLSLEDLETILWEEWDERTSSTPESWDRYNPERGQCVPASLVVQDFFGGEITRVSVTGQGIDETHYYNIIDGATVDMTIDQYGGVEVEMLPAPVDLEAEGYMSMRDRLVSNANTSARYELLRSRVMQRLGEKAIR